MLICDTHADTLYAMQLPAVAPYDVSKEFLTATADTRVQALALFVGGNGLRGQDGDLVERELRSFEDLKEQGFRQIFALDEAVPGQANAFLTIEGGEAFGDDAASVERFAKLGVKLAALVWNNENALASPAMSGSELGLKPFGRRVVRELRRLHIGVDISHLNERGAWELMEGDIPPMASHSCARALCDCPRNLTDEQLRALFHAGGFVGVNFYPFFLTGAKSANLDDVIDHMAHMCDLGGERCVGLGSDFDGIECKPAGLENAGKLPALFDRMKARGFGQRLVENIAGENFARYMAQIGAKAE